jgi:Tfp pilus assembly protein PilN
MRQAERKPLGSYMMMTFCTILAVSALCCTAYLYFSVLKEAETNRNIAKEQFENLAPMAKYADDLDKEKKEYTKRSQVIEEIENARILWTRKIDQLLDVVNNGGNTEHHWVWLKDLKIRTGSQRGDSMDLKGYCAGDQFEQLSNFNDHIKKHALFENDFASISNPTGSIAYEKKMKPASAIEFSWEMKLKEKKTAPVAAPVVKKK